VLRSRFLPVACAIAAAMIAPDIAWQVAHGMPNLGVYRHLQQTAVIKALAYWPAQVFYTSVVLAPLWLRGLRHLLRDPTVRPAGIAAAFVLVIQFVLGGKPYYPAGIYPLLFAAGSVGLSLTAARTARYCAAGVLALLISLPVLPTAALWFAPLQAVNPELGEQVGWPGEVALAARAYHSLSPAERRVAGVLTENYGEAGAIDRYGPAMGLPQAYSGHNSFWTWGPPPPQDTIVIAIGVDPALLRAQFTSVRLYATYDNGLGVRNTEQGTPVYIASGRKTSWTTAWPAFRHYD
jgi:hypothetical protein